MARPRVYPNPNPRAEHMLRGAAYSAAAAAARGLYGYYMAPRGGGRPPRPLPAGVLRARRNVNRALLRRTKKGHIRSMKKQIKKIKQQNEANMGDLTYRYIDVDDFDIPVNKIYWNWYALSDITDIEAVLAQLRYYDPTAPTNLVTADFATGSYQKEVLIELCSLNITTRANYTTPAEIVMYACRVKDDTSQTPLALMQAGDSDVSNVDLNNPQLYPSDIPLVTDLWKLKVLKKRHLEPGQQCSASISVKKPFTYDPHVSDTHNLTYQRRYGGCGILLGVNGGLAHDTTLDEQGLADTQVDIMIKRTYRVKYNAGASIKYIYVNDQLDAFTNDARVCVKDTPDQVTPVNA